MEASVQNEELAKVRMVGAALTAASLQKEGLPLVPTLLVDDIKIDNRLLCYPLTIL
jgi:hypothetical protein